jgi:hypothetical protein
MVLPVIMKRTRDTNHGTLPKYHFRRGNGFRIRMIESTSIPAAVESIFVAPLSYRLRPVQYPTQRKLPAHVVSDSVPTLELASNCSHSQWGSI